MIGQTDPFVEFRKDNARPAPGHAQQAQPAPVDDDEDWDDDLDDAPYQPQPAPQRAMPSAGQVRPIHNPQVQRPMVATQSVPMHEARPPQGEADARQYYAALQNAYPAASAAQSDQYDDDDLDDDEAQAEYQEYYDDPPAQRSQGSKLTVVAILCLAVVGTGGAFAYRSFFGGAHVNGAPPVIHADTAPTKIVPTVASNESGKPITDRLGGKGAERVVPREEQPVDMREQRQAQPRMLFPPVTTAPESTASTANPRMSPLDEPKKIRTVPIRPEGAEGGAQNSASRSAAAQRATPSSQPQRPAAPTSPAPEANSAAQRTQTASLAPVPLASTPAAQASGGGNYLLQVSSQRSEADAQSAYRNLQGRYPMLASRSATIRRADLGEKGTYYRVMVGPFGTSDEAAQFCTQLRAAGGQCLMQRN